MNNNGTRGALTAGFFIFIAPATVIGHGCALKLATFRVFKSRVVNQNHYGFSVYIQPFVIIPVVFRGIDAITNKNEL